MLKHRSFRGRRGGGEEGRRSSHGPFRSSKLQDSSRTEGRISRIGDTSSFHQRKPMRGGRGRGVAANLYGSRGVLRQNGVFSRKAKLQGGASEEAEEEEVEDLPGTWSGRNFKDRKGRRGRGEDEEEEEQDQAGFGHEEELAMDLKRSKTAVLDRRTRRRLERKQKKSLRAQHLQLWKLQRQKEALERQVEERKRALLTQGDRLRKGGRSLVDREEEEEEADNSDRERSRHVNRLLSHKTSLASSKDEERESQERTIGGLKRKKSVQEESLQDQERRKNARGTPIRLRRWMNSKREEEEDEEEEDEEEEEEEVHSGKRQRLVSFSEVCGRKAAQHRPFLDLRGSVLQSTLEGEEGEEIGNSSKKHPLVSFSSSSPSSSALSLLNKQSHRRSQSFLDEVGKALDAELKDLEKKLGIRGMDKEKKSKKLTKELVTDGFDEELQGLLDDILAGETSEKQLITKRKQHEKEEEEGEEEEAEDDEEEDDVEEGEEEEEEEEEDDLEEDEEEESEIEEDVFEETEDSKNFERQAQKVQRYQEEQEDVSSSSSSLSPQQKATLSPVGKYLPPHLRKQGFLAASLQEDEENAPLSNALDSTDTVIGSSDSKRQEEKQKKKKDVKKDTQIPLSGDKKKTERNLFTSEQGKTSSTPTSPPPLLFSSSAQKEVQAAVVSLQPRLQGVLNRVSEGNVEVILQQILKLIHAQLAQLPSPCSSSSSSSTTPLSSSRDLKVFRREQETFFFQTLSVSLSSLLMKSAIESKFSTASLIATQTALCCALTAAMDTPSFCSIFLVSLGKAFKKYFPSSSLLMKAHEQRKDPRSFPSSSHGEDEETRQRRRRREKEGEEEQENLSNKEGNPLRRGEEEEQGRLSSVYIRHILTAFCFLFDYNATPPSLFLQLLRRLCQGVEEKPQGDSDRREDIPSAKNEEKRSLGASSSSCRGLSEFQIECLLMVLRLGGGKLRNESPALFKEAWTSLMKTATLGEKGQYGDEGGRRGDGEDGEFSDEKKKKSQKRKEICEGGKKKGSLVVQEEEEEKNKQKKKEEEEQLSIEEHKRRLMMTGGGGRRWREDEGEGSSRRQGGGGEGGEGEGDGETGGGARLRFLIRELQELKNNKTSSVHLASKASQEAMRRWLHTSPLVPPTSPLRTSAGCLVDVSSWKDVEEGHLLSSLAKETKKQSHSLVYKPTRGVGVERRSTTGLVGDPPSPDSTQSTSWLLEIAAKLRLHTDQQRSIFLSLMTSDSPNSAVQRILQSSCQGSVQKHQVTNIIAVILHTCLQEKFFNPFYCQVLGRLCGYCCCSSSSSRQSLSSAQANSSSSSAATLSLSSKNRRNLPAGRGSSPNTSNSLEGGSSACTCFFLPAKEGTKFKRVLQRGLAAQNSAAHGSPLRRLLHLAKLEAFLLCMELLCPSISSKTSPSCTSGSSDSNTLAPPSSTSLLRHFLSLSALPDVREAFIVVMEDLVLPEITQMEEKDLVMRKSAKTSSGSSKLHADGTMKKSPGVTDYKPIKETIEKVLYYMRKQKTFEAEDDEDDDMTESFRV
ncbi:ma3 domain [Cystoisospora suis]|uniref:Ma3 domain n=1 Tax=Cystoisospora suis TaxID=483139 RepID=A0A2C6LER9_9APIC|nr:ma3 domain [Cystoisospora suis]